MREQFEKLPEIANLIQEGNAFYCDKGDWYLCPNIDHSATEMALDMAWYAYQEQQKKIDSVIRLLDEKSMYHKTSGDRFVFSEDVGELLK